MFIASQINRSQNMFQVIYDMDEEITTFKMFDVSTMCTCGELLSIAASAYCFPDVSQYCLQAISDKESRCLSFHHLDQYNSLFFFSYLFGQVFKVNSMYDRLDVDV